MLSHNNRCKRKDNIRYKGLHKVNSKTCTSNTYVCSLRRRSIEEHRKNFTQTALP